MSNTNKVNVPEAKGAMNRFKMECASEVGVQLTDGYNGNLTSAQAGSGTLTLLVLLITHYLQQLNYLVTKFI